MVDNKATEETLSLKEYTEEEIAKHNTVQDCWLIIGEDGDKKVYDVTKYLDDHPGGPEIILDLAGQDANEDFEDIGHSTDARKVMEQYLIGKLKEDESKKAAKKAAAESGSGSGGNNLIMILPILVLLLALAWKMVNAQE